MYRPGSFLSALSSWPGLTRPSIRRASARRKCLSALADARRWMAASRAAMTKFGVRSLWPLLRRLRHLLRLPTQDRLAGGGGFVQAAAGGETWGAFEAFALSGLRFQRHRAQDVDE